MSVIINPLSDQTPVGAAFKRTLTIPFGAMRVSVPVQINPQPIRGDWISESVEQPTTIFIGRHRPEPLHRDIL